MSIDIKVPVFPESVTEGTLTAWHKRPGDRVSHGEVIADIETDKVVFEVPSLVDGVVLEILVDEGVTVHANDVVARVDEAIVSEMVANDPGTSAQAETLTPSMAPAAEKLVRQHQLDPRGIAGSGKHGQILKEDVLSYMNRQQQAEAVQVAKQQAQPATEQKPSQPDTVIMSTGERPQKRVPMSRLRARIAERLVEAQRTAAILTTFNEVNMQPVMDMRSQYRELFEKKHGVRLGFMSLFVRAAVEALKDFPEVNASIEHDDIVYHGFFDIGIAVGSPRGLVVPVLRDADALSLAEIEKQISDYGQRAQSGQLSIEEITGGTFSITNGGVFGSLLSTPILNPPQSGILGMHKIEQRPVVIDGEIVIRPMMYLAFSYDHRIIDGREAVQFLVRIKEIIEDPSRLLLGV